MSNFVLSLDSGRLSEKERDGSALFVEAVWTHAKFRMDEAITHFRVRASQLKKN